MALIYHPALSRGHADHGWLIANHTFSFSSYYDPDRMNFGALRVLNDDTVAPKMGFATHPHDNMEIITIPLEGEITHQDSMGNEFTLKKGDIQVMSAGTGILHSERNSSASEPLKLLQIWVIPNKREVTPRYDQISFDLATTQNKLQQIISPNPEDVGSWIYQNAWFHIGRFDSGSVTQYTLHDGQNGVYAFVISGQFEIEGQLLNPRDGLGILNQNSFDLKSLSNESQILLMEVPMSV